MGKAWTFLKQIRQRGHISVETLEPYTVNVGFFQLKLTATEGKICQLHPQDPHIDGKETFGHIDK